jgi:biotin carboxylase
MNKTILIIGAGVEQIKAYKTAKDMGLTVVGTDINLEAPAFNYADYRIIASTRNVNETVESVFEFVRRHRIDGVMTIANDVPLTVAAVATRLGLPSIPIASALIISNKILMKTVFDENSILTPPYAQLKGVDDIVFFIEKYGLPIVIKPVDGRGSRGVLILRDTDNIEWAYNHAMHNSESASVMVEKFIDGVQYSTESIVYKSNCITLSVSERNYELFDKYPPYAIENGGVIPALLSAQDETSIHALMSDIASSLGVENGTVKGDIIMSDKGAMVIEAALRLSGGYLSSVQIPIARGVDLVKQTIKMALGEELIESELKPKNLCWIGIRYFFPEPGKIIKISGFDELDDISWVIRKQLFLKVGDIVEWPTNHTKRAGYVYALGDSFDEAERRAISAARLVEIETG